MPSEDCEFLFIMIAKASMLHNVINSLMLFTRHRNYILSLIIMEHESSAIYPHGEVLVCMVSGFVHGLDIQVIRCPVDFTVGF
ncbi:hypothetical protein VNO77_01563 [Canavalia gladiata]|uniref:Uncharacterized protein n=1 Tax=Canavalia gladiata TaxID=3824 RepID=A0AAN9MWN2_CANGL